MKCLICDKDFVNLRPHLVKHKISAEKYRKKFGIAFFNPLTEKSVRQFTDFKANRYGDSVDVVRENNMKGIVSYKRVDEIRANEKKSAYLNKRRKEA